MSGNTQRASRALTAVLAVGALALVAPQGAAAGCGLLGVQKCPPSSGTGTSGPAADPGGSESPDVSMPPPGGKLYGFSSNLSEAGGELTPVQEYDMSRASGANVQRIDVFWSQMEPGPPSGGVHRWSESYAGQIAARYNAIHDRGMVPILELHSAPSWAQEQKKGLFGTPACSGSDCWKGVEPDPARINDWRAFVRFVALRYPQSAFQVWNEPNLNYFYRRKPDPGRYLALFKSAYDEVKAVSPGANVLLGSLNGLMETGPKGIGLRDYLQALYAGGLKSLAPGYVLAVNIYPHSADLGAGSEWAGQWDGVADALQANADLGRRIWLTETGLSTSPVSQQGNPDGPEGLVATPAIQRDVMRRIYNRAMTMDTVGARRLNVRAVIFHTLKERKDVSPENPEYGYGFVSVDRKPKPAFCWMAPSYPGC